LENEPELPEVDYTKELSLFSLRWGGAAGDGLQSIGLLFGKYLNKHGYFMHGTPGNQSSIRGGHIWYQIDISNDEILNTDNQLDMIVALNDESVETHIDELKPQGILMYNQTRRSNIDKFMDIIESKDIKLLGVPLTDIARDIEIKTPVLANTVALGVIINILQWELKGFEDIITDRFGAKQKIVDMNIKALHEGYNFAKENFKFRLKIKQPTLDSNKNIVVNGNHAIALGAAAAGLKFLAQYPITPASSILTYLSQNAKKFGIVTRQVEDEISAVTSIIGAAWAGARSMTATSGPGISLMAENTGLAGITETPIVIVDAQRGGPSTGVPTKTEQSDLLPSINLSHGEFPRAVFAPRTISEAYTLTVKAFNIAEKYQIPVFILSDFQLSEHLENVSPFNFNVDIDRGFLWEGPTDDIPKYHRYGLTDDGISPRLFPPHPDGIHVAVGAEHDFDSHSLAGHSAGLYRASWMKERQFEKRFKKLKKLEETDMDPPEWYGPDNADITLVCWGGTTPAVKNTVDYLNQKNGKTWNVLSFSDMFPIPAKKTCNELDKIKIGITVEGNWTGQLEQLLLIYCDWKPNSHIRHIDGEVFTKTRIIRYLKELELEETPGKYTMHRKNEHYNKITPVKYKEVAD
jgi:2-oxoglutarate/2-oxoacid ferredoxin oxidoreductase subunit alpha